VTPRRVTLAAPAKVNLRLLVLAREETGYHSLETIFCAISLADELVVQSAPPGTLALEVEGGVDTGPIADNLVLRAAARFYRQLGEEPAVRLTLRKRIPAAAGLGGGSSDAATALLALNALHDSPFRPAELMQAGSELGSDVPFFLCGSPLALGWGRGERLLSLPALPARPVLVAHPGVPLSTPAAFQRIARRREGAYTPKAAAITLERLTDWDGLATLAVNDFGAPAEEEIPSLTAGLEVLRSAGASIALLAGSGASIFGVFPAGAAHARVAEQLRQLGFACWAADTLETLPTPTL
jgi:4-diphosphocytidyl-2-C-methyl-D-erythritol kinase